MRSNFQKLFVDLRMIIVVHTYHLKREGIQGLMLRLLMCKCHLICLDIVQDVILIFLANSDVKLLLIVVDQLLNVYIISLGCL